MYGIKNEKGKLICVFGNSQDPVYNIKEIALHMKWAKQRKGLKVVKAEICPYCDGNVYVPKRRRYETKRLGG